MQRYTPNMFLSKEEKKIVPESRAWKQVNSYVNFVYNTHPPSKKKKKKIDPSPRSGNFVHSYLTHNKSSSKQK